MRMHWGVGIFVSVMALSLANCSSRYRDDCQAKIDCEGGNDADVDACVDGKKGSEDIADAYDCGDAYGDAADCLEGKGSCKDGHYSTNLDQTCTAKLTALVTCEKAASTQKSGGIDK